jgi:hypothetical protein
LEIVCREIFDSEYKPSFPKRSWMGERGRMTCVGRMTKCLVLHGCEDGEKIDERDSVREIRRRFLRQCSERKNAVEIKPQSCVDIINESLDVLLGTLGRAATAKSLIDRLIVFDRCAALPRYRDNDTCTAGKQTLEDLNTNRLLPDTRKQCVPVLDGGPGRSDFVKDVQVDTREVAAVFPGADFAFEAKKGDLVSGDAGDLGTKGLGG